MLAAAAAGLCDPTISIEYKARVERTLRELDPGDVQLLDQLRTFHLNSPSMHPTGIPIPRATYVDGAKHLVNSDPMARGVLLTTACIDTEETGLGPLYLVTQLGDLVLRVLKTYLRGKSDA